METQSKRKSTFDIVYKLAELLTAIFFILLCLSVTVQVIARYFFNLAFDWGEELPIFLFLWVSFLAAAIAYRDGSHLSVDFIVALFPKKVRFAIYYINLVLSLGFVLILAYYEGLMTLAARNSTFVVMKVSKASCYVGIPVSCILFAFFIIEKIMTKNPKLPEDGRDQMPDPESL